PPCPYTTLFRSERGVGAQAEQVVHPGGGAREQRQVRVGAARGDVVPGELLLPRAPLLAGAVVTARPRRHIGLDADDRLDAGALRGSVELVGAEEVAVVRDGHGLLALPHRLVDEPVDLRGPVQQRVVGVDVEVDEVVGIRGSHALQSSPAGAVLGAREGVGEVTSARPACRCRGPPPAAPTAGGTAQRCRSMRRPCQGPPGQKVARTVVISKGLRVRARLSPSTDAARCPSGDSSVSGRSSRSTTVSERAPGTSSEVSARRPSDSYRRTITSPERSSASLSVWMRALEPSTREARGASSSPRSRVRTAWFRPSPMSIASVTPAS